MGLNGTININFRDFLNAFPEKAMAYDLCKQNLASQFSSERSRYMAGKQEMTKTILNEARL